jgi:IS30 family transposase
VLSEHDLPIAPSTYHAHKAQPVSDADLADAWMANTMLDVWRANRSLYGSDKLWTVMQKAGHHVGRDQVARLMKILGIEGVTRGKHRTVTTRRDPVGVRHPDLVKRAWSTPTRPDQWWVADFTYVWTLAGFAYVSFVTDVFSRRILGWRVSMSKATPLVMSALEQALFTRRRQDARFSSNGLVFHSDAGSQGGFNRSSQHLNMEVAMQTRHQRQLAIRKMRGKMWSPGRPSTARREDRVQFWEAIGRGLETDAAAAEAGVASAVGCRWFREAGGMPPLELCPVSGRYLSFSEREEIAILYALKCGVREIARRIGRSPSTISRELRRNAATRNNEVAYRATTAQWHAERRASRPKVAKLAANDGLREYVQDRLGGKIARPDGEIVAGPDVRFIGRRHGRRADRRWAKAWSPEQVSNRLRIDFPGDRSMRISHEAIYQGLFIEGRGALERELVACLRTGRALRVPRARRRGRGRGKKFVTPEVMINKRPAQVEHRRVPGHWEGDLILGLNSSAIGTLVERTSRFTVLLHLPHMDGHGLGERMKNGPALAGHGADAVRLAIAEMMNTLPKSLWRSLTWDQGAEMAQHDQLRLDTGLAVYFCKPHSPWQRGTNENTNGLLRQYFPKGTDLSRHSRYDLDAVALAVNTRPRKVLGWKTPIEVLGVPSMML